MKKINWKDLGIRAAKTFVQTFLSCLTVDGVFGITDGDAAKKWALTTGLSALAAAISAVWNLLIGIVSEKAGEKLEEMGGEPEQDDEEDTNDVAFVNGFTVSSIEPELVIDLSEPQYQDEVD